VNPLALIEKLITEHGSSSILRDNLCLLRDQLRQREEEILRLRRELAECKKQQAKSPTRNAGVGNGVKQALPAEDADFVEHREALFKKKPGGGFAPGVYCPQCHDRMSSNTIIPYRCGQCGFTAGFNSMQLSDVLKELPK